MILEEPKVRVCFGIGTGETWINSDTKTSTTTCLSLTVVNDDTDLHEEGCFVYPVGVLLSGTNVLIHKTYSYV